MEQVLWKKVYRSHIKKQNPSKVIVFSRDEQKHFEMSQIFLKINIKMLDICDRDTLEHMSANVDIIIHF